MNVFEGVMANIRLITTESRDTQYYVQDHVPYNSCTRSGSGLVGSGSSQTRDQCIRGAAV